MRGPDDFGMLRVSLDLQAQAADLYVYFAVEQTLHLPGVPGKGDQTVEPR